jgi:hypothetical protein
LGHIGALGNHLGIEWIFQELLSAWRAQLLITGQLMISGDWQFEWMPFLNVQVPVILTLPAL